MRSSWWMSEFSMSFLDKNWSAWTRNWEMLLLVWSTGSCLSSIETCEIVSWGFINLPEYNLVHRANKPLRLKQEARTSYLFNDSSFSTVAKWFIKTLLSLAVIFDSYFSIAGSTAIHVPNDLHAPCIFDLPLPESISWVDSVVSDSK